MSGSLVAALIVFERKHGAPPGTAQELIAWWRRRVSEPLEVVDVSFLCPCCCDGVAGFSYPWEVREEIERQKLPAGFFTPIFERVQASLTKRAGKQQKFSTYQSLTLPASAFKWSSDGKVTLPTSKGRRTLRVRVDNTRAGLRPVLEGRPVKIVFRNGELSLVSADVEPPDWDDDDE